MMLVFLRKANFGDISKHLKLEIRLAAKFDKLWGVWKCGQALSWLIDISSQLTKWKTEK